MGTEQTRFDDILTAILDGVATVEREVAPAWLIRPGRAELGEAWPLAQRVYAALTGLELPETAPSVERRRLDMLLTSADGSRRVVEFDENQHFSAARLVTLDFYEDLTVGFPIDLWRDRCHRLEGKERGGGYGKPKPPLFPGEGGRHRQRAFRDFLADVLPPIHGWLPTVRFMNAEVEHALRQSDGSSTIAALWSARTSGTNSPTIPTKSDDAQVHQETDMAKKPASVHYYASSAVSRPIYQPGKEAIPTIQVTFKTASGEIIEVEFDTVEAAKMIESAVAAYNVIRPPLKTSRGGWGL